MKHVPSKGLKILECWKSKNVERLRILKIWKFWKESMNSKDSEGPKVWKASKAQSDIPKVMPIRQIVKQQQQENTKM